MKGRLLATLVLLVFVVAFGTAGYVLIEGWSVWDALYMTITTVATVGFREIHPLTRVGSGVYARADRCWREHGTLCLLRVCRFRRRRGLAEIR